MEVDIKLKEGVEPYRTNRTQRLDYHELQPAWAAVEKALAGGWLREHDPKKDKPIEWLFCGQLLLNVSQLSARFSDGELKQYEEYEFFFSSIL